MENGPDNFKSTLLSLILKYDNIPKNELIYHTLAQLGYKKSKLNNGQTITKTISSFFVASLTPLPIITTIVLWSSI